MRVHGRILKDPRFCLETKIETSLGRNPARAGATIPPVGDREELHLRWMNWVTTNLGRDTRLAEIATLAASDAAARGQGFNKAEAAARTAWADAANPNSNRGVLPRRHGHLARNIAIGCVVCLVLLGAATGVVLWFAASMAGCYAVMC